MFSLVVDHPDFPKGTVFSVPDLVGVEVVNGETTEIPDDVAASYGLRTGNSLEETFKEGAITVKGASAHKKGGDK